MVAPMNPVSIVVLVVLIVWEMIWKGIACWKSARNKQLYWFLAIFILNTLGILSIVYLKFFQKDKNLKK